MKLSGAEHGAAGVGQVVEDGDLMAGHGQLSRHGPVAAAYKMTVK